MTDLDLDAIETLVREASDGPWERVETCDGSDTVLLPDGTGLALTTGTHHATFDPPDAEFITHARELVLTLVAEVRRLTAELAEAEARGAREEALSIAADLEDGGAPLDLVTGVRARAEHTVGDR